jgi:hypothetical protein
MKNAGRHVQMTLSKTKMGWWPQLVVGDKPHWLKIDFDKWKDPDESDGDDQDREPAQVCRFPFLSRLSSGFQRQ